jgi:hypothetical protein
LLPVGVALLATFLNPYGPQIYVYPFTLLRHDSMLNFVQEWFSPDFHASYLKGYQLGLFLVPAALILSRRTKQPADMLLLSFWAYQSLQSRRHIPVFLILALPVLAEHLVGTMERLGEWWRETSRTERRVRLQKGLTGARGSTLGCLALTALVLAGVGLQTARLPKSHLFEYSAGLGFFPRQACDFIDSQGWSGRLYNEFDWGGYCIWRFYPRQRVFIDGRCEVYFGGPWENHHAIHYAQADWEARLRAARVDTLLVNPNSYLCRVLPTSREWERVYADSISMVYRRRQPFEM